MAETSDRVSSMAARYRTMTARHVVVAASTDAGAAKLAEDIRSMAASLARQDETKGLRGFIKRLVNA